MLEGIAPILFKLSKDIRLRHDEAIDNYYLFCIKTGKHIRLNTISYEIVTLLEKGMDKNSINSTISKSYDTDGTTYLKDIEDFLNFLQENEMVHVID